MTKLTEKQKLQIIGTSAAVGLIIVIVMFYTQIIVPRQKLKHATVELAQYINVPQTKYVTTQDYFKSHSSAILPSDYSTYEVFDSKEPEVYLSAEVFTSITDENVQKKIEEAMQEKTQVSVDYANQALYDLCDQYFTVYFQSRRVSPILPLAIANAETGGRADHNVTWSSLFPSKYVDIKYLYTMDVTTVMSLGDVSYKALTTEYSTRDRGALQMSPTYGTKDKYFNSRMSGNEQSKLSKVDTSAHADWVSGASDQPGDRFYIPDVLLRLSAAMNVAVSNMLDNNYIPSSDIQLVAQLAMYHQQSGVWYHAHDKKVGRWKSGELAYKFSQQISERGFVNELVTYAEEHPECYCLDSNVATKLYNNYFQTPMDYYSTSDLVCIYPIKVMYNYIKLCLAYNN